MFRFVQLLAIVIFVPSAFALKPGKCESLLERPPSQVSYAVSDLEGLYLHIIAKVQTAPALEDSRMDQFIRDVLNMKAELLNRMIGLMQLTVQSSESSDKVKAVRSMALMLSTLGIPLEMYGLEVKNGKIAVPQMPTETSIQEEEDFKSNPIGFLKNENASERDLAPTLHRSIGFAPHTIAKEAPPARRGGMIRARDSQGDSNSMVVLDDDKEQVYAVNIHVLRAMSARLDGHDVQLGFNKDIREWVIIAKNLNNPTGKMGF